MPLTEAEQNKLDVITAAIERRIINKQAAIQLKLTVRQLQRLKAAVKTSGTAAVVHKLKGKSSNHRIDSGIKNKLLEEIKGNYSDFKPSFATEKLQEKYGTTPTPQTIRIWMTEVGLWKVRKQKAVIYRSWRPRKEYFGQLIQFDGSYHHWFENRLIDADGNPVEVCLLAAIDDATGTITKASFGRNEGVIAIFLFWLDYVQSIGKPIAIYLDKYSTYKINHKAAVDNFELVTQFSRAMQTLSVELIFANSPQAKGRVERLFKTLQDRLIKELRLANVNTISDGNKFLEEVFLPKFNSKFGVTAAKEGDVHQALTKAHKTNLKSIFSVHLPRHVNGDFTIRFKNNWYQLLEIQPTTIRAGSVVTVEEHLNKKIYLRFREKYLSYIVLPRRPPKTKIQPLILTGHKLNWKPPVNHPWRKRLLPLKG